jgi:pimeloyl-ACP methyl ester carboxylesterase
MTNSSNGRPDTGYARVAGLDMYYEVHGTGRPLVLLHGGLLTIGLTFGAMLPTLAANHRVIAVELQGHGRTADTGRELGFDHLADDVDALLDQLGVATADVFGFSLGGLVALRLAMRHPARVERLVVAAAHYRLDGYYPEILDPARYATSTRMPTAEEFAEMRAEYERVAPDPGHFEAFAAKASALISGFEGWADAELRAVGARTLVVIGDTDFVRVEHAARMRELIPEASLAVLPDTTHTGLLRRTDLLLPMVETVLAERAGAVTGGVG